MFRIRAMDQYLQRLLAFYQKTSERAGVEYRCLADEGNRADALETEEDGDSMTLRIQGPLDGFFGVSADDIIQRLDKSNPQKLHVLIDSPGGFVKQGMTLYSDFRGRVENGVEVSTEARGLVASAAVLPFVAGDDRTMGDGAMLMIHNVWSFFFAIGDASEIETSAKKSVKAMNALTDNTASIIAKRTSNKANAVAEWMNDETWFDAEEAVENGFAVSVMDAKEDKRSEVSDKARAALLAWKIGHRANAAQRSI